MTPALAKMQETPVKRGERRSPSGHAASAVTMKNNAGTMKNNAGTPVASVLPWAHEKTRCGVPPGRHAHLWIVGDLYKIR
jgi:hypothetical protein